MIFSQNMTIHYNDCFINLYVEPGDSIHLTIDASLLDKPGFAWLTIQGKDAAMREQLNRCVDYLYRMNTSSYLPFDFTKSPQEVIRVFRINYAMAMDSLNQYAELHRLDSKIIQWAQQDMKYLISNDLSDYIYAEKDYDKHREDCKRLFTDSLFEIGNEKNFESMMFPLHLGNYMQSLVFPVMNSLSSAQPKDIPGKIRQGVHILRQEPATTSRDYMIYSFLAGFIKKDPSFIASFPQAELSGYFVNPVFVDNLNETIERRIHPVYPKTILNDVHHLTANGMQRLPSQDLMDYLTQAFPNKVIYIDVYATWCGPCRREFKLAPEIHSQFHGKEVVFVNLCLQSLMDKWKDFTQEFQIEGENYFLDSDATKLFMSAYGLTGFPSYILIDRQGTIKSNKAPRLSEKERLEQMINDLLL